MTNEELTAEVARLRAWVNDLQAGMFINCVYCGHRYGPDPGTPVAMADVLKAHVEACPEHPLAKERAVNDEALVAWNKDVARIHELEKTNDAALADVARLTKEREAGAERCRALEEALQRIIDNPCLAVGGGDCRPDCNHADHVARRALTPSIPGGGA